MDVTALLVFVSGFVVCAGVVFLISIFGAKEETFEEALAKQRKANEKEKKIKDKKKENDNSGKKNKNWRMKKKGERDDKNDGLDEVEEEPVVVVPAGAKVEEIVEAPAKVEEAPVEPKPTKKEKKKKIDIQEVESVPETKTVVEPAPKKDPVPEVAKVEEVVQKEAAPVVEKPAKASPSKQKAKKDKAPTDQPPAPVVTAPAPTNPKELLTVIKKTSFSDQEAQKLIDVLLTKQSGDALNTSDDWIEKGKPTETQRLKQELSETLRHLEEERMRVKSFTDKVTGMRKELNEERAAKANFNRTIEDFQKARGQEVGAINSRLQQVIAENTMLKNNLQNELAMRRNVEMGASHFQATIDNLTSQLDMAKMAASQAKANDPHLQTELEQLRTLRDKYENTLAEINITNSNLKSQINQQTDEITSIKQQLSSSSEKVNQLTSSNTNLEKSLAAKSDEAQKASAELKALKSKPKEPAIINNNNINVEEIEAELAKVKQKLSEKEKEAAKLVVENKKLEDQVACSKVETAAAVPAVNGHAESSEWREKFESLQQEHDKMVAKQKVLQSDYDTEVSSFKGQVDSLKSKNNDLSKSLQTEKKSCQEVLHRLFPSLSSTTDLADLEAEAADALENLGKNEAHVAHYKSVLAQTESMLTSLQSSVEAAETEWRNKLETANKELTQLKSEKSASSQAEHINSNQMQVQLSDLQQRLAKEEEDKVAVVQMNEKLQNTSDQLDKEVERLSQELSESRRKQDELSSQLKELQVTNINLKEAVSSSQEALAKEQNLVKRFQEQVSNGQMENGQSPETVQ